MIEQSATQWTGHQLLAGIIGPCPQCGNGRLRAVSDGELTNFLCVDCQACWHGEPSWVHRIDPATCPGCPSREVCLTGVAADIGPPPESAPGQVGAAY